ncbi:hypothetical protein C8R44DRAFT_633545, partial [Mycena epipterygia]
PQMVFPHYMTRANAASPDTVYQSGSAVVLSPTDSMIYYWKSNSKWPMCYLTGWVSATQDLIEGNKSYTSEGNLTTIEVWNLTIPANPKTLKAMTWNTRPARVSLLGTVNFTSVETQHSTWELDGQELRAPTPRLPCLGDTEIAVEIACATCRLKFNQVFSLPPLGTCPRPITAVLRFISLTGFELIQLG